MKFVVSMKDPDVLHDSIREAVGLALEESCLDLDDDEREQLIETRSAKVGALCVRWFECGEYLRVEIDTDAKTCTVIERSRR